MRPKLPYRGWLFDLDGTVYLGERSIPGADAAIAALRAAGRRVAFLSNKPLQTRTDYAAKLTRLGVPAAPDDVINSSLVLARYLRDRDPGAPVFVIGEPPMQEEMRAHGFEVRPDERVRWVVIAFDRTFDYAKLNTALQAVRQGARLIATNPDRTCPVEGGEIPDCAGMIAAVEAVTDRKVEAIVGKPSPIILEVALAALGRPRGRGGDRRRPHRHRHRDGATSRPRHRARAERRDARGRSANRRDRSGPRGTIDRGAGGVSAPANRLAGLDGAALDAVVIGGGMAGAGVARDLALRGASVALFEKGDFASGTSSKSSKLIHGGLRYLELCDFELVRESLREKKTLERLAPHLVRPLPFLVPVYRGAARGLIKVRIGMWLYDLLTPGKDSERYRVLRPEDALSLEPSVRAEDLRGAGLLLRRSAALPGAPLSRERALGGAPRRPRPQLLPGRGDRPRGARGLDGVHVRDLLSGQVRRSRAPIVQLRGAVGRRAARARGGGRAEPAAAAHDEGHPLPAAAHDRPRRLPLDPRRPDDLRHPVARVLAGRHDRHRLRRRPGPPVGDPRRGGLPARRGGQGAAGPARHLRERGLHLRRGAAALLRAGPLRLRRSRASTR